MKTAPRSFILDNTALQAPPHVPEIRLQLADEAHDLWLKTEEELEEIGLPPPFWAFAWAGGQALARYILDHPDFVRGRKVLDVASGSGLVAIAAAKAGAATVEAADIDAFAAEAIAINAEANGVRVTPRLADLVGTDEGWDVVLTGDIFYERDIAERMWPWLASLELRGAGVLIGDPGRSYLPKDKVEQVAQYRVQVTRELEDAEIKLSRVWRIRHD